MQPNLKIPQAPYVRSPLSIIPRTSIIDMSLDKLMEQKIREAQYNAQQQAVASRTPTVLTDPLLNLRVRDYYRQKYERSLITEVAGRVTGTLEGAAIGAGIATSLLAVASIVAAFIPGAQPIAATGLGTALASVGTAVGASAATATTVGAAVIGAGVGAGVGLAASDYTTWYATRDMFANLWKPQPVGRGILNTLSFVGQSMDLLGTSAVVKSTLYALINNKNIGEIIAQTYGLTEKGRTDMDFSMIRESLGLDLGGVGNFVFDMTGETLSDLGNLAGITKGSWIKSSNKIYTKYVTDSISNILQTTDDVSNDMLKLIARYVRENNVDDLAILLKTNKELSGKLVKELGSSSLDDLRPYLQKFIDNINESAIKTTTVKMANALSNIDFMDDAMTGILMRTSNPGIAAAHIINRAPKLFGKLPVSEGMLKYVSKAQQFIFGNLSKSRTIARDIDDKTIRKIIDQKMDKLKELYTSSTMSKELFSNFIKEQYPHDEALQKLFEEFDIDDISSLYKNKDKHELLNKVYEHIKKANKDQVDELEVKEAQLLAELDELNAKYEKLKTEDNTEFLKQKEDLIKQYTEKNKEYMAFISSTEYDHIHNIYSIINDPEGFANARKNIGIIWTSNNIIKDKAFGKLTDYQKEKLNEAWKSIIEDYIKNPDNDHTLQALEMFNNSQDVHKMIDKYVDQEITKELAVLYKDNLNKYTEKLVKLKPEYYSKVNDYLIKYIRNNAPQDISSQLDTLMSSEKYIDADEQSKYNQIMKLLSDNYKDIKAPRAISELADMEKEITDYNHMLFRLKKANWIFDKSNNVPDILSTKEALTKSRLALFELYNPKKAEAELIKAKIAKEKELFLKVLQDMDAADELLDHASYGRSPIRIKRPDTFSPMQMLEWDELDAWTKEYNKFMQPIYDAINTYYGLYASSGKTSRLIMMRMKNILNINIFEKNPKLFMHNLNKTLQNIDKQINDINEFLNNYTGKSALMIESNNLALLHLNEMKDALLKVKNIIDHNLDPYFYIQQVINLNQNHQIELIEQMFKEVNRYIDSDDINNSLNKTLDSLANKIKKSKDKEYIKWANEIYNYLLTSRDDINKMSDIYKRLTEFINNSEFDDTDALDILETQLHQFDFDFGKDAQQAYYNIRNLHSIFRLTNFEYQGLFKSYAKALETYMKTFGEQDWTLKESKQLLKVIENAKTTIQYLQTLKTFGVGSTVFNRLFTFKGLDLAPTLKVTENGIIGKIANEIIKITPDELIKNKDKIFDKVVSIIKDVKEQETKLTKTEAKVIESVSKAMNKFNIDDELDKLFPHYYKIDKITAMVHQGSNYKRIKDIPEKIKLGTLSYITFDTEITGGTVNGLYSLGYTIHRPGKAPIHKNILLNPKYAKDNNWVFDAAVDQLYDGGGQANWDKLYREHITDKDWIIVDNEEDIIKMFKQDITDDDILIAFNAAFDYDQLVSKITDDSGFDYTIFDAQKVLSLTGIQNPNKPLTNVKAAQQTESLFDNIEHYKLKDKDYYWINGEAKTAEEFKKFKSNKSIILTEYDSETGQTISKINGKPLHEARNDVDLMNEFVDNAFKQLDEQGYNLTDLTKYYDLKKNIYDKQITETLYAERFRIKNILDKLNKIQISETGIYKYDSLIEAYKTMFNPKFDAHTRLSAYNRFKDAVESIKQDIEHGELKQTDYSLNLQDLEQLELFTETVDINLIKQTNQARQWIDLLNREEVAFLQTNKAKVNYMLQYQFSRPNSAVQRLLALFNGNSNKVLTGRLADFASRFYKLREKQFDIFTQTNELSDLLNKIQTGTTFVNDLYNDLDPRMYDAIDNIIDDILEDYKNNIKIDSLKSIAGYREKLAKRAEYMGFDLVKAYDTLDLIIKNIDSFDVVNAKSINRLYQLANESLIGLISSAKFGIKNNELKYSNEIVYLLNSLQDEIKIDFAEMRTILSDVKATNHQLRQEGFTLTELNQISQLKESEFTDGIFGGYAKHKFMSRGSEIEFENGVHTMLPSEAVANRSAEVIRFTKDFNQQDKLRKKANQIFADLYKPSDTYKALPITGIENNRLFGIVRLGGQAIGINMYNLINGVTSFDQFKDFNKAYKREQLLELFDYINLDMRNKDTKTQQMWLQFISQLKGINDATYPYIKDTKELQERIKCIIAYNYSKTNLNNVRLDGSNIKIIRSVKNATDGAYKDAYDASINVFDTVKSLFTHTDGTFDLDGFRKWLNEHDQYVLCQTDTVNNKIVRLNHNGKIRLKNGKIQDTLEEVLKDDTGIFNLLSKDTYIGLTNEIQHIMLPDKFSRFLRRNLLGPLKMWSLFNFNFLFQNATAASMNTMVSTSGKINMPKTIFGWIKTARDMNKYNDVYSLILNSDTCIDLLSGSVDNYINNWLDLLDNKNVIDTLIKNGETDLADVLTKLTPDQIKMLKDLHTYMMTTSAFGEINAILNATKESKEIRKRAEKLVKDFQEDEKLNKYVDTILHTNKSITKEQLKADGFNNQQIDEILDKVLEIKHNKYQMMSKKELKELLDAYDAREFSSLSTREKRDVYILRSIYNKKESDFSEKFSKYNILKKWLNVNEEMETIIRVSALRQYLEDGLTLDEATNEVIKRQFIYNNKSMAEQYAEFIIPFISYPLRMIGLVDILSSDAVTMDLLYRYNKYSWGDEDATRSDYLMRRKARGDIPVGNKLLQLTSPFNEGVMNLQNPLYTLNNKVNPIAKPFIDLATGVESDRNRWNQLPLVSNVSNLYHAINERNVLHNVTSDYYKYSSYGNYYLPRVNNRIHGTLYNRMYTYSGKSRVLMNMQPLNTSNLKYRVKEIMKYGGPYRGSHIR